MRRGRDPLRRRRGGLAFAGCVAALALGGCPRDKAPQGPDAGGATKAPRPAAAPGPAAPGPAHVKGDARGGLRIRDVSFAGPAGHRPGADFARGEAVTVLFSLSGFTYEQRKADLVADVRVDGPDGELVLAQKELPVLRGAAPTLQPGEVRSALRLELSPAATPGRHEVTISARDRLARHSGEGKAAFTIIGAARPRERTLRLAGVHLVADGAEAPGGVVPVGLELRGVGQQPDAAGEHRVDVQVATRVRDAAGKIVATQRDTLVRKVLPFAPRGYPAEYAVALPRALAPGRYRLELEAEDRAREQRARAELPVQVEARRFAVYSPHLHDAAHLSRRSFLFGEQTFVRFEVQGFAVRGGAAKLEIDFAIIGPDNGIYLSRRDALPLSPATAKAAAQHERYAAQLPLVLPAIAPAGFYRLMIRARDRLARRETTGELRLRLQGAAPKPLGKLAIDALEVRRRPDLPAEKGDAFVEGRKYHLALRVGGAKLKEVGQRVFSAQLEGGLSLRDLRGAVVHKADKLFRFERKLRYRPLRILIPAQWTVPAGTRPGLYDLQVQVLNRVDDMVSQLTRRVAILSGGRIAEVPL